MAGWAVSGFQQQSPKRGDNKLVTIVADRQAIRDQPTERERKAQRPAKQQNSERQTRQTPISYRDSAPTRGWTSLPISTQNLI
ncbi:hypothetical protein CABS01_03890 [Colletotrichum abscissum]|uniref:uncharacterized protein n=1 Tax=Colletotrichum abscissum TaxID=1671311 RepID=UPI0027D4DDDE|nr:uncharacterized protein CABS01_03890 [Colletotrichum abscissum]KAK1475613.1 hypothetical protein CABS01_03890 [Colletotrichum abscissum]